MHANGLRRVAARAVLDALCCAAALLAAAARAPAQPAPFKPPVQFEARIDALGGPPAGVQAGAGGNVAAGYYLRIAADLSAGASARGGRAVASGRVDVVTRFLFDPFDEFGWGPYAGGGFSAQWNRADRWRGELLVVVGVEGPARAGWRTSVELGLGGGARLGVVLRRARSNGR